MNEVQVAGAVVASLAALGLVVGLLVGKRLTARPWSNNDQAATGRSPRRFPPAGRGCWSVTVEVARLGVDHAAPDQLALELSGLQPASPGAVVHATSWCCEDAGHLVLTYAALACPPDREGAVLRHTGILRSPDPLRRAPAGLHPAGQTHLTSDPGRQRSRP